MKKFLFNVLCALATVPLISGCVNPVEIIYSGDQRSIDRTLGSSLSQLDPGSSGQLDHIKNVQFLLLAPRPLSDSKGRAEMVSSTCAATFTADTEIHIRRCKRVLPSTDVVAVLKKAFPKYETDLASTPDLKADYLAPYETRSLGLITRGEETWLLFNKKTGRYFFYENAHPDPKICQERPEAVDPQRW